MKISTRSFAAAVLLATACAPEQPSGPSLSSGSEGAEETPPPTAADSASIALGATAVLPGTAVSVTWLELEQDSRCPSGVDCVWEGDAAARIRVLSGARSVTTVLHTAMEPRAVVVDDVVVTLVAVLPYPVYGQTPDPASLRIVVHGGSVGSSR